ncbi:polyprenyl synthetase family protein [Ruicaihuangia caeni]|uniref:Polyprenyl synthetase family protein n=1 Tax=Ruicaihuangia caeni TaxID=3042517 RepID=A0AAW6T6T1_9MICO|nr:polyprenyl synthetase family protein [Klugiella sp. YN-L-19]MDI2098366.1 polyprenyl synthetase family protein [Klugiella sp. YN-L-19]
MPKRSEIADLEAALQSHLEAVSSRVTSLLEAQFEQLSLQCSPAELVGSLNGGKMLRARLAWLVANAFGTAPREDLVRAGAAIQLLHSASLVHDDIIDDSAVRRGRPTLHILTDAETAILIGDLLVAMAFEHVAPLGREATAALASAFTQLCRGQLSEASLSWGDDACERLEEYARLKTGALFGAAFELGALSTGMQAAEQARCRAAGEWIGVAFQFADDLLDVQTDVSDLDKDHGADIRNGIPTLPIWHAYHSLGGSAEEPGAQALAAASASEASRAFTVGKIAELVERAEAALPTAQRPELLSAAITVTLGSLAQGGAPADGRPLP